MLMLGVAYKHAALVKLNCTVVIFNRTCNCNCVTCNDLIRVITNKLIAVDSLGFISAGYLNCNGDTVGSGVSVIYLCNNTCKSEFTNKSLALFKRISRINNFCCGSIIRKLNLLNILCLCMRSIILTSEGLCTLVTVCSGNCYFALIPLMTKSRKCLLANCMLATLVRALFISCVTVFLAGCSLALNVNESVSIGIDSDFFCLCMRSIILTSEGLNTGCYTSRSSSNFTCIPSVTCCGNFLCVGAAASASEGHNTLGFATGSGCNLTLIGVLMYKAGDYALFLRSANRAVAVLCTVSVLCRFSISHPFAPCVVAGSGNSFLRYENLTANVTVRALCKAVLAASGSNSCVGNGSVTERCTVGFATNRANSAILTGSGAAYVNVVNPLCIERGISCNFVIIEDPCFGTSRVLIPAGKIEALLFRILRLCNKAIIINLDGSNGRTAVNIKCYCVLLRRYVYNKIASNQSKYGDDRNDHQSKQTFFHFTFPFSLNYC